MNRGRISTQVFLCFLMMMFLMVIGGCSSGGGDEGGSNTPTKESTVVAVSQKTGPFGAIMVSKDGEMLLPIVDRDASGKLTKITGALYVNNVTGERVLVYLDIDGRPTKTVIGDYILLYSNWSASGKTVDIVKIYTPTNYIEIFKGVSINAESAKAIFKGPSIINKASCFPGLCATETEDLAALLRIAALGINIGVCGTATVATFGIGTIFACSSLIVTTANLVMGDEKWLGNNPLFESILFGGDVFACLRIPPDPPACVTAYLETSAAFVDLSNAFVHENSENITAAEISFSNPNQLSGVVQQGGGLPSVPSGQYQCTPGGAMHYVPCLYQGVRECQSNYKYGPCMCGGVPCNALCTSFTYSSWSACVNNTRTRTITSRSPDGCTGGTPEALTQSCTPQTCTYTYSDWSACSNNTQTRTVVSSTPDGCTGTPVLSQSCKSGGTPSAGNYTQSCTVTGTPITCCAGGTCSTVPAPPSSTYTNSYTVASGTSLSQLTSNVCSQVTAALSSAGCSSWSCNNTAATSNSASFSLSCSVSSPGCTAFTVTETCSLSQ